MRVYHGSDIAGITKLLPSNKRVYLTQNPAITVLYMVNPLKVFAKENGLSTNFHTRCAQYCVDEKGVVYIPEPIPEYVKWVFSGQKGYLYYLDIDENKLKTTNKANEKYVDYPIKVDGCIVIDDVYEYILEQEKQGKIIIQHFETRNETQLKQIKNGIIENLSLGYNTIYDKMCREKFAKYHNITDQDVKDYIKSQNNI